MFCEQAEKREKKDFSFINLTFAAFGFSQQPLLTVHHETGRPLLHLFTWILCANLGPIYCIRTQWQEDELQEFCSEFLFDC